MRLALPGIQLPVRLQAPTGVAPLDPLLLVTTLTLMLVGLVMITSASMDVAARDFDSPAYFILRHSGFLVVALLVSGLALGVPVRTWEKYSGLLLLIGLVFLVLVLIPGIGREVNGSRRWIALGPINIQASEIAKACMVIFISGYLVRRLAEVRSGWWGVVKPAIPMGFYGVALLMEPDYGALVVLVGTVAGMVFLGGMRFIQLVVVVTSAGALVWLLAIAQPYRLERLKSFTDPWSDPYGSGYQLSQAQIAFGRGDWFGTGLGNSVQKLFYLPEAHTDFVYSVLAEELGLVGALVVVALYVLLVARMFIIGRRAEKLQQFFKAYMVYGFAFIIAGQALINIGVNVGALPTKGLTLPLISYGGSSLLVCAGMIAIVLRVDYELKCHQLKQMPRELPLIRRLLKLEDTPA
jgi:cell division protein FtsW